MSTTPTTPHRVITRKVVDWAAWDWGSAAFNAVATTFVFTTYLTSDGVFTDSGTASTWLSNGMTIAGLFIALLAPITGQRADRRGRGGVWLGWFTGAVVVCMLAMYFVHPESVLGPQGALMLGIALLGLGNVFFEFASVNYNAMLNHLGEKEDRGKISGFGWAAGYIGGIVLLLILYVGLIGVNLLGVPTDAHLNIRISMVIAALWFGGFAIPVIVNPPLPKKVQTGGDGESIIDSYKLLWRTVRTLKNEAPHTLFFLIASAVFRDGLAGVFTFGAVLAKTAFGFTASQVMIFAIARTSSPASRPSPSGGSTTRSARRRSSSCPCARWSSPASASSSCTPAAPSCSGLLAWSCASSSAPPSPRRVPSCRASSPPAARVRSSASTRRPAALCPSWLPRCTVSSSCSASA